MNLIKTEEETVKRMMAEICMDMRAGRVPRTVTCFGDLHDHVDANEYGGFCEDEFADAMIAHFGGRDEHEGMPQGFLDYINRCQDAIDSLIRFDYFKEN